MNQNNQLRVDATPELLNLTGQFNVVFDPERHRTFPGTTSVWTVITSRVRRRATSKEGSNFTTVDLYRQSLASLQMKKLLACGLA